MAWKRIKNTATTVKGTLVVGDKTVSPTRWYNIWWMWLHGWQTIILFEATGMRPFQVGFTNSQGEMTLNTKRLTERKFRVRIGHEDCTFFAFDASSKKEIPLVFIARAEKSYANFQMVRLI